VGQDSVEGAGFEQLLLEAVDDGLKIIGESVAAVVYYYWEQSHSLKREDIPKNLELFDGYLKGLFGFGAQVIEDRILESFYSKLGLTYDEGREWGFADHIKHAIEQSRIKRQRS